MSAAALDDARQVRRLRVASWLEGTTLLALVLVAVPLKHLAGWPLGTRIVGPVHGAAFVFYAWTLLATVSGGGWRAAEIARLALAAFVPFGAFANVRLLRRREAALLAAAATRA